VDMISRRSYELKESQIGGSGLLEMRIKSGIFLWIRAVDKIRTM